MIARLALALAGCLAAALVAGPVAADVPAPPPAAPPNVAPTALEAIRTAGDRLIPPDDATVAEIAKAGTTTIAAMYKVCVDDTGTPDTVSVQKSSGFAAYDRKVATTIQATWRFQPYPVDGVPTRVCTAFAVNYLPDALAVATDPDRGGSDAAMAAATDLARNFFMAIAASESTYFAAVLRPPVAFANLAFEDPACTKQFPRSGTITKAKLKKFSRCLLSLVRAQASGELALTAAAPDAGGAIVVTAQNTQVTIAITYRPDKRGDLAITAIRSPGRSPSTQVLPPTAAELVDYLAKIRGKGALRAEIETSLGTISCTLYEREVPRTVANFVGLATGQKAWLDSTGAVRTGAPFYRGLTFHRVIPAFMIQGGDPYGNGTGGPGYTFPDEIDASLKNVAGTLVMANAGPDTNGSQFFINLTDNAYLDGKFAVFGACPDLSVATAIAGVPRDATDRPKSPVTIVDITIRRGK